jgi:hypothetical protein|tara:strand:+ start:221 stop:352 length:132 start_codon:yes stop_codon:yes gene_type:complete
MTGLGLVVTVVLFTVTHEQLTINRLIGVENQLAREDSTIAKGY